MFISQTLLRGIDLEFQKLAHVVETNLGQNILNRVTTRWISVLEPLKRILGKYKTLIVKFNQDAAQESATKRNLSVLCDIYVDFNSSSLCFPL